MFKKVSRDRLIGFVLLGIIVMGISSYFYFADTFARMKTEVEIPSLTHETPANLRIRFVLPQSEGKKHPIAPLDKLSKEVTSGISISPAISGKWFWYDEDRITFVPKQDWPANQLYKIHMNESLFAKEALAPDDYDIRFTTLPFGVNIQKISLQQAPADEKGHHLFSTLRFTHPVNTQSLAEHLKLYDKAGSQELSFTLNYEDDRKTAYVKSEDNLIKDLF
jgi:alpha-2-macroglobulin